MSLNPKLPEISREEFIKSYCELSGLTWEELQKWKRVIPAAEDTSCDFEEC